ncbi:unnamed protein product [Paramecium sonneborni]|uniref:WD40-repeat-containing domain n=1 Tax=Paramecium sonneborni TaxID=65129 RepID=A0A8S1RF70_9CILI|nr:unnamed protein product [Paramecium sonneborni]
MELREQQFLKNSQRITISINQKSQYNLENQNFWVFKQYIKLQRISITKKLSIIGSSKKGGSLNKINTNSLFSGSGEGRINFWQYNNKEDFISKSQQFHTGEINCMILNKEENLLVSGNSEQLIIIWKVNCQSYEFEKIKTIQADTQVEGLALSPSETILAYTGKNKQIINGLSKHKLLKQLMNQDQELVFQMILVSYGLLEKNQVQILYQETKIKLNENKQQSDFHLFDIIQNREKNILIIKQKQKILIMKQNYQGQLEKIEGIDCKTVNTCGTLALDGSLFIYFDGGKFFIYKLQLK